ncbi:hypothetical protein [Protaetiibacter larvae]|uniref:Uncharacterized protein n=1 Tax=Protaetiibacter larvae TaxID=2592654 RepID=A0A5C1Y421_9MICO|nr:hypothetical protein [Protaetiibacter larvae]QEO08594.1 hypothetical protein FLP23_00245 [Protaetiibacter larvae]
MKALTGDGIRGELVRIARELPDGWRFSTGADSAYGLDRMEYAELLNPTAHTSVRVWWAPHELRVSAILAVPYEASSELITGSLHLIGEVVFALCSGRYVREGGEVRVTTEKGAIYLNEWVNDPVEIPGDSSEPS